MHRLDVIQPHFKLTVMTSNKFVFTYTETHDFEEPVEVTIEVPERSIEEMCEYFQRFLTAAGYLFESDERIRCVPTETRKSPYPTSAADILTFNDNGSPFVYDFGDGNNMPVSFYSGVRGGMADDIIKL
jgi:hypothetical protein